MAGGAGINAARACGACQGSVRPGSAAPADTAGIWASRAQPCARSVLHSCAVHPCSAD